MIRFSSFNKREIRKRSEFAYMACMRLAMTEDLHWFYKKVCSHARFEWHPSLVEVYFDTVCVEIYRNEIDGSIEEICFTD